MAWKENSSVESNAAETKWKIFGNILLVLHLYSSGSKVGHLRGSLLQNQFPWKQMSLAMAEVEPRLRSLARVYTEFSVTETRSRKMR